MTDHPLTDEMCLELSAFTLDIMAEDWAEWQREDMRAAADWQLEQVIKYLEDDLPFVFWSNHFTVRTYMDKFKKAMRPQEDN